ncbi:hypothetical protein SAMN05443245_0514 [Paraburkholderia fungorum]|uniref:Uncharacterized protein n=1 Tax=Paraburkholderia fungorum TaxID=134537 RepID=A0A1H0Z8T3_9BURK|nr:hypothetical protein SAMN05443245_0514 [Paraburkholderia fungorum]
MPQAPSEPAQPSYRDADAIRPGNAGISRTV